MCLYLCICYMRMGVHEGQRALDPLGLESRVAVWGYDSVGKVLAVQARRPDLYNM